MLKVIAGLKVVFSSNYTGLRGLFMHFPLLGNLFVFIVNILYLNVNIYLSLYLYIGTMTMIFFVDAFLI